MSTQPLNLVRPLEQPDAALARLQAETQRMADDLLRVVGAALEAVAQDGAR